MANYDGYDVTLLPFPTSPKAGYAGENTKVGAASSTTTYYKRARDSNGAAPPPPASYVYWTTPDPVGVYPLPPPFGGPLVETTILNIVVT